MSEKQEEAASESVENSNTLHFRKKKNPRTVSHCLVENEPGEAAEDPEATK